MQIECTIRLFQLGHVHGSSPFPMTDHNKATSPYEQLDIESQSQCTQYQELGITMSSYEKLNTWI